MTNVAVDQPSEIRSDSSGFAPYIPACTSLNWQRILSFLNLFSTQAFTDCSVECRRTHSRRTSFSQAARIAGVTSFGSSIAFDTAQNETTLSATSAMQSFMIGSCSCWCRQNVYPLFESSVPVGRQKWLNFADWILSDMQPGEKPGRAVRSPAQQGPAAFTMLLDISAAGTNNGSVASF